MLSFKGNLSQYCLPSTIPTLSIGKILTDHAPLQWLSTKKMEAVSMDTSHTKIWFWNYIPQKYLPLVLYTYRTSVHFSTGVSPFMMYGRQPKQSDLSNPTVFNSQSYPAYLQDKHVVQIAYQIWILKLDDEFSLRWDMCNKRVAINTGPGPRTGDQRTRGPGTQGPGTQWSSSVALSNYDRNATCVNVLSSNVRLYCCWSPSLHCYTHRWHSSQEIVLFHATC